MDVILMQFFLNCQGRIIDGMYCPFLLHFCPKDNHQVPSSKLQDTEGPTFRAEFHEDNSIQRIEWAQRRVCMTLYYGY